MALGENTHLKKEDGSTEDDGDYQTDNLVIQSGTLGALTFIANWKAVENTGDLKVEKIVSGIVVDPNEAFSFEVQLKKEDGTVDTRIDGQFGAMTFKEGVAGFTLKGGESLSAIGLPEGLHYTVEESDYENYNLVKSGGVGVIEKDQVKTATLTNTRKTGALVVTKKVKGETPPENDTFHFTLQLLNGQQPLQSLDLNTGNLQLQDGTASFELSDGDSITIEGLPVGVQYVVSEEENSDYTTTSTNASGTIREESIAVEFDNIYPNKTGNLSVSKTVEGVADPHRDFTLTLQLFQKGEATDWLNHDYETRNPDTGVIAVRNGQATFKLKAGETLEILDLPANLTAQITEAEDSDYRARESEKSAVIPADDSASLEFINERLTGDLTISKTVEGQDEYKNREFHFSVILDEKLNGEYGDLTFTDGNAEFTLVNGQTKKVSALPAGIGYEVVEEEANQDGYQTVSQNATGTIVTNQTQDASFTNTKWTGDLEISKTVNGRGADANKLFTFNIQLSDSSINGKYGDAEFTNGKAVVEVSAAESKLITGLPEGLAWTVTETADPAYTAESSAQSGTIDHSNTALATFTNTFKTGELAVTKMVEGNEEYKDRSFNFTISLDNPLSGKYGDLTFKNGKAEFTLSNGEQIAISELPAGTTYEVVETEANQNGYTTTSENATGKIEEAKTSAVSFTNTKWTGDLEISKTVNGRGADANKLFTFTIQLSDSSINGKYGDAEFTNGEAVVEVSAAKSKLITGLPEGVEYTVTETADQAYTAESSAQSGTINHSNTAKAAFTNTFKTGKLVVTKTVEGNEEYKKHSFNFTISLDNPLNGKYGDLTFEEGKAEFALSNGEQITISELPAGTTYEVVETEADTDGYTTTSQNVKGTIGDGTTQTASFTNTKSTGDLKISKTIVGNAKYLNDQFTFEVDIPGFVGEHDGLTFVDGNAKFELGNGDSRTISAIPSGTTYTVRELEANQNGYTTTSENATGTIEEAKISAVSFTNTKWTGDLEISKTVNGRGADENKLFTFTIQLSDSSINGKYGDAEFTNGEAVVEVSAAKSKVITGLPEGVKYTVTETADSAYTAESSAQSGTINHSNTAKAAFTNTFKTGGLVVTKTVEGNEEYKKRSFNFTISLDNPLNGKYGDLTFKNGKAEFALNNGKQITISELPSGTTYEVVETEANTDGYTTTSQNVKGAIGDGTTQTASFTNTKSTGDLKISKKIVGNAKYLNDQFTFEVDIPGFVGEHDGLTFVDGNAKFELGNGESKTISAIPSGSTYTVRELEANQNGYTTTSENATGTIEEASTSMAVFTNTKWTGDLKISKKVNGRGADKNQLFTFEIELSDSSINKTFGDVKFTDGKATVQASETAPKILSGLPEGLTWTVTETEDPKYTAAVNILTGTIKRETTAEAAFTNTFRTGDLTITKQVEGNANYKKESFSFEIQLDQPLNGQYGDLTFVNGNAKFKLTHDQSIQIKDLPADLEYEVTEIRAGQDGYSTVQTNAKGKVIADEDLKVLFTNTKWTGDLEISKTVNGVGADHEKDFEFAIRLSDRSIQGRYGDVEFTEGQGQFILKDGQKVSITGLPENVHYEVQEVEDKQYFITSQNESGTIEREKSAKATFTNTFKTGNLSVTKTIEGNDNYHSQSFDFVLILSEPISGTYGQMTFVGGQAKSQLSDGQILTAENLPADLGYEVTETAANQNGWQTVSQNAKGTIVYDQTQTASFINTKSTGDLTITKTIEGNPEYLDDRFTFEVVLPGFSGEFDGLKFVDGKAQFELGHQESRTIHEIPSGTTYQVRELMADQNGYTTASENETGIIEEAKTASVSFANTKWTGALQILKNVEGKGADSDKLFTFDIELLDSSISGKFGEAEFAGGKATVEVSANAPIVITDLPENLKWKVTEREDSDYRTEQTTQTGKIERMKTVQAVFTNTFKTGSLTISDLHQGNSSNLNQEFHFLLTLDQPLNGQYGDLTFNEGQAAFTLNHLQSVYVKDLPAGIRYVIEEEQPIAFGWTSSSKNTASMITDQEENKAEFIHEKWVGSLKVEKQVEGIGADPDQEFAFTLTLSTPQVNGLYSGVEFHEGKTNFTLKAGESLVIDELPAEMGYEVSEEENSAFDSRAENAVNVIEAEKTAEVKFTNTFKTGGLVLSSTLTGNEEYLNEVLTFEILLEQKLTGQYGQLTFTNGRALVLLENDQSVTLENLPVGMAYEILELDGEEKGFTVITPDNAVGEIEWNKFANVHFENSKWTGDLKLTQTTQGRGADLSLPFVFDLEFTNVRDGEYGDIRIENGKATLSLTDGQSALFKGLPEGTQYSITTADQDGYVQAPKSVSGTIERQKQHQEDFLARYLNGGIVIHHHAEGNPKHLEGTFLYQVQTDPSLNGQYGDLLFENGRAQFEMKEEGTIVLEEIPASLPLSVELVQTPTEGWTTWSETESGWSESTKAELVTPNEANATVSFLHNKWTGTLIVENKANGNSIDLNQEYYFEMRLDDPYFEGTLDGVTFVGGLGRFTLKADERKVFEDLPADLGFELDEIEADQRYTVVVEREDHVQTRAAVENNLPATGNVQAMNEHLIRIIHSFDQYGTIEISNRILGSAARPEMSMSFVMTLDDPSISGTYGDLVFEQGQARFSLMNDQILRAVNLPYGISYRIEEEVPEGWLMESEGTSDVLRSELQKASFINRKDLVAGTDPGDSQQPQKPQAPDSPETGADSGWISWLMMLATSLVGVVFLLRKRSPKPQQ